MKSNASTTRPRPYEQTLRAQAAEATGQRVIEAFLARLMRQWFDEITLDAVAEDAGVTVQTVIRRFDGKDGLLAASLKTLGEQIRAGRTAPAGDIDRLVDVLLQDYEQTGDTVLRLLALESRQPSLKKFLDYGRDEHRQWVAHGFIPANLTGTLRERAIDILVVATDVYTWKLLRRDMGRSIPATKAAIKMLVQGALGEI